MEFRTGLGFRVYGVKGLGFMVFRVYEVWGLGFIEFRMGSCKKYDYLGIV